MVTANKLWGEPANSLLILTWNTMQYSWLPQERRQLRIREKPPLVISLQRYARLQANAKQEAKAEQLQRREQQQLHEEQLRRGGEELLLRFAGRNVCPTQEQQCSSAQRRHQEQLQQTKQRVQEESVAERRERQRQQRVRIEKAQQLLEQLRPGPRDLLCAKQQSEVLRGIHAQRQLQTQLATVAAEQRAQDQRVYGEQVHNGLEEAQRRHSERMRQLNEHKRELRESIEQRQQERNAVKAQELEMARQERQRNEEQREQQLAKERAAVAAKMQLRRQHACASLLANEQRRQRLQMLEEVEQLKCDVHNEAKAVLERLKIDRGRQRVQQRLQRNHKLAQELAPRLHYSAGEDQARHKRQLEEMRRAHSVEQQTRRQRLQQTREQRVSMQREEQEQAAAVREQEKAERRESVERRLQNELIHLQFQRQQRQEKLRRECQLRAELAKQEKLQKEEQARPDINYNRLAQLEELREDAYFVDYALRLMIEARDKGCPLEPFMRTLEQYKQNNRIGAVVRVPRHLITKLTMGRRTQGDSTAERLAAEAKEKDCAEEEKYRKSIAENLKKIEDLVKQQKRESSKEKHSEDNQKEKGEQELLVKR